MKLWKLFILVGMLGGAVQSEVLFQDTFNRPDSGDINASTGGIINNTGTDLSSGAWTEAYGAPRTEISGNQLNLAVGTGSSNVRLNHNFINSSILSAGGFSVSMDVANGNNSEYRYGGAIGIGLSQTEAASGLDAFSGNPKLTQAFDNGTASTTVLSDFWFGWRDNGVVTWGTGADNRGTVNLGQGDVTLSADFLFDSFSDGSTVNYTVYIDGTAVSGATGSFTWSGANENYIAIDGRDNDFTAVDNVTVESIPEPASMGLLLLGATLVAGLRRRVTR